MAWLLVSHSLSVILAISDGSCSQTVSMNEATFSDENPIFANTSSRSIIWPSSAQFSTIASSSHSCGNISDLSVTKEEPPSSAKGVRSVSRQHFLYFLPLPQGQGSLRPVCDLPGNARDVVRVPPLQTSSAPL